MMSVKKKIMISIKERQINKLINRDKPLSVKVGFRVNLHTLNDGYNAINEDVIMVCPHCGYELFTFDSEDFKDKDYQDMENETDFAKIFNKYYDLHCQNGSNSFCHRCGQRLLLPNDKGYNCHIVLG